MRLKSIELAGFMVHANTVLAVPPNGVMVFTGENGAGKSSIAEAIAYGRWGKTLRGKDPWKGPVGHLIHNYDDGTRITRVRKGGKVDLKFNVAGAAPVKYESQTKAQEGLEQLVGGWTLWKKSSVFSSSDRESFTTATDGDRKRLVEELLGIDRFDAGLKAVRLDLGLAKQKHATAERDLKVLAERVTAAEQRAKDAADTLALAGGNIDVPKLQAEEKRLCDLLDGIEAEVAKLRGLRDTARSVAQQSAAEATRIWERLGRLGSETCPSCEQKIPGELKEKAAADTRKLVDQLRAEETKAHAAVAQADDELSDLTAEHGALTAKLAPVQSELRSFASGARAREQATNVRQAALEAREEAEEAKDAAKATFAKAAKEIGELSAVERVLGLKGVRAHLLGDALTGLQEGANAWLSRIAGPGMKMVLNAYSETDKGAVSDKISFDIEGAGNGHGYLGSSGGERRRLDVAIMLALGDMASAAQGVGQDVLVFDEVFDALDKSGVEAVVDVVKELGQDRFCIVITHNDAVVSALSSGIHYEVAAGKLTRLR